jgi:hypothetical protein
MPLGTGTANWHPPRRDGASRSQLNGHDAAFRRVHSRPASRPAPTRCRPRLNAATTRRLRPRSCFRTNASSACSGRSPPSMDRQTRPPASAHSAGGRLDGRTSGARPHHPHAEVLDGRPKGSLAHPAEPQDVSLVGEGDETVQYGRGLGAQLRDYRGMLLLAQMDTQISSTSCAI